MEHNKRNMKKLMQLIAFTVLLLVGMFNLDVIIKTFKWLFNILLPFIIGCGIAFILSIPMKLFEEKVFRKDKTENKILNKIRRPLSILLSILCVIGLILIVVLLIAPEFGKTLFKLFDTIPQFFDNVEKWVNGLEEKYPEIAKYLSEYELDWDKIGEKVLGITQTVAGGIFSSTFTVIGAIVSTVTNFLIGFVFAIYLLANKEKLSVQCKKILYSYLPIKRADRIIAIAKLSNTSFANFISGQCVEAVIEGCLFFLVLTIFHFDYAILIGVLATFMALIPIFGAFITCALGFVLLFMISPVQALWFIVIDLTIQQVESNLIYPYVVGGSIGLPSLWVLFAVTVGGNLMGVVGMLIFIPLFSVCYVLLREFVNQRLQLRRIPEEKYKLPVQTLLEKEREQLLERNNRIVENMRSQSTVTTEAKSNKESKNHVRFKEKNKKKRYRAARSNQNHVQQEGQKDLVPSENLRSEDQIGNRRQQEHETSSEQQKNIEKQNSAMNVIKTSQRTLEQVLRDNKKKRS